MAAKILHFGEELNDRFPLLRAAGYSIDRYDKILDFGQVLQSGAGHDAVSLSEQEEGVSRLVVETARAYSRAPLILFRTEEAILSSDSNGGNGGAHANTTSEFDLVVPASASLWWIAELGELIARSREVLDQSQRLKEWSAQLLAQSAAAIAKTRFEVARARSERTRNDATAVSTQPVDRVLTCAACGVDFVFSADEQLFYRSRDFVHDPKQCRQCRARRRKERTPARVDTTVTCAVCGTLTTVPFRPIHGRPVLCLSCYEKNGKNG